MVALAPLVPGLDPPAARPPGHPPAALKDAPAVRTVAYRGVLVPVPAGWSVHRLDRDPSACVRYDRRAIYLGAPGPQPDCPARLLGGADVLHITPRAAPRPAPAPATRGPVTTGTVGNARHAAASAYRLARLTLRPSGDHQVRVPVPEAGVTITGSYGRDPAAIQEIIRSIRLTGTWPADSWSAGARPAVWNAGQGAAVTAAAAAPYVPGRRVAGPRRKHWTIGRGFDTCTAPSLRAMRAWRRSYNVTNIYIGGSMRGCAQPNLTRRWVRNVRRMGYRLTPTYVGPQAPCSMYSGRFTPRNAARKGRQVAVDAMRKARALGIPEGRPIYYDMEYYNGRNARCRRAVLIFLHHWSRTVKRGDYVPGVYSSARSAPRHLAGSRGITLPKALWFADWDGRKALYGHPHIPNRLWHPHRRIKQYRGPHKERHGGVTLNIDSNSVDGRVY
ncbi:glycoside hydrolase domain-containing protein [Actinomadura viridis]|uniref:glycoside hydrolase domain-containing protein n=1 Tax=Actinomadura viridis TaxID=58110 RepID=UPI0036AB35E0